MARVNAYLYLLENEKPQNPKYTTDNDLLPKDHPKSTRNNNAHIMENLQEEMKYPKEDMVEEEEKMEYPKDKEDMEYPKEDKDMVEHPEDEKEMEGHPEEEKEMEGHPEEEEKMEYPKDKDMAEVPEEVQEIMDIIKEYPGIIQDIIEEMMDDVEDQPKEMVEDDEEGEVIEEENMTAEETQVESQEESGSAALDHSERAELEAFRRERKEGLIVSFEDDLSGEFLDKLRKEIGNYSFDELEVTLSKEFTRVNRENKKSKPNAFIYKPEVKSSSKSEVDVVKDLIQKYK
jgi:hypothetical protein